MIARIWLLWPLAALLAAQPSPWTMARLPGTGQTGRFTTTFGQDSDYALNPPALAANGDSTVTDFVTGLLWQQNDGGEMTWENAGAYCKTLALGGYRDWRLPFAHEAFSILNHNTVNPAMDTSAFTKTNAEYWWAADPRADDASRIWVTNAGGGIGAHPKNETISAGGSKRFHVRCVRSPISVNSLRGSFTGNGDGTVTDNHTGLMWQKEDSGDVFSWEDALRFSEELSLAGYSDWRLPNIKELRSINDDHATSPSIDRTYFAGTLPGEYWSSTTLVNQTTAAWTVDFMYGIASYRPKATKLRVRSVRGGFKAVTTVSAATFAASTAVAPGSIASAFGEGLTPATEVADSTLPLPTTLAGTTVSLTSAAGYTRFAPLFAVAQGQINFLVPEAAEAGVASLVVASSGRQIAAGVLRLEPIAPGLFTANANGKGVAAAMAVRVRSDGLQTAEPVFQCGPAAGSCGAAPIDLGSDSEQVILALFGTGMRGATGQATATIGGMAVGVAGPVAQGQYAGLDQVNLGPLPRALAGRGEVDINLSVDGKTANRVTINIR